MSFLSYICIDFKLNNENYCFIILNFYENEKVSFITCCYR